MSDDKKQQLEQQLWKIADTLRGKMDADDFRDYILGFIFYKYLSEKMYTYANTILKPDKIKYLSKKSSAVIPCSKMFFVSICLDCKFWVSNVHIKNMQKRGFWRHKFTLFLKDNEEKD